MDQDRERRRRRLADRKLTQEEHRRWLRGAELEPLFSGLGREETFTGVLLASLLNPLSRPVVLRGLGIPEEWELIHATSDALPIDLVLSFIGDGKRELAVAIEVKWADSASNYPGYRQDVPGQAWADDAPSQLDRAHQLTQMSAFASHGIDTPTECVRCGYKNVCPAHGCLRGCKGKGGEMNLPWTGRPALYPKEVSQRSTHWWTTIAAAPDAWNYVFLDYDGRPAYAPEGGGAYVGVCSEAWRTSSMKALAKTLRDHYDLNTPKADAKSLEPLLEVLFTQ